MGTHTHDTDLLKRCALAAAGKPVVPRSKTEADVWRAAAMVLGRQYASGAEKLWEAYRTFYETHHLTGEPASYAQLQKAGHVGDPSQFQFSLSKLMH
ncbi:hypothetical protein [Bordetella sp. FB-8]|uniref:hypothetical protein n=1 Tax=Bordetella sp. FB-8 TaxID=1159870 RepID=UPI000382B5C8|nr:hypothetical protein [Bordetella sp. FB-8]